MKGNSTEPSGSRPGGEAKGRVIDDPATKLFERQAALRPGTQAVRTADGHITYEALNQAANRVAWAVRDRIGPVGEPVGIVFGNDISFIAAMLGVIKSGNILLPLSSEDPQARIVKMVEKAGARLVLTDDEGLRAFRSVRLDATDTLAIDPRSGPVMGNPEVDIDVTSPAILIFTSGSTGDPKGVPKNHLDMGYRFEMGELVIRPDSRVSVIPSLSFTSAIGSVFRSLTNGATACRFNPKVQGIHRIADWIRAEGITLLWIGPATLRAGLDGLAQDIRFPTVRAIYTSGAPLLSGDVDLYRRHFSDDCVLINTLASAEAGMVARYVIDKGTVIDGAVVPVGQPMPGVRVFLLDEQGREVPPGEPGIMHVDSPRLVAGYWRDPELTKRTFVPHPAGGEGVVYRSGDLAIRRSDGCLVFVGRDDDRVKVRGYSVDLLEVERAILALGDIREAAVVSREINGEARLIAYVVPQRRGKAPSTGSLRAMLSKSLPAYAVPTSFVTLDSLPLTPRGKVDRRALPVADVIQRPDRPLRPPVDDLERSLVEIWRGVLGTTDLGTDDHFFDELAGTSMQALRVFAEIARTLDRDLAPTTLLRAPTVASLAEVIRGGGGRARQASLVPLRAEGSKTPLFCVHGGGGGAFFVRDLAANLDPDRPVYGLQVAGFDGVPTGYRPVEELATRYLAEIRTVQPRGPYLLSGLSFGGLVALEMAQLLAGEGEKTELLVLLDSHRPTDRDDERRHAELNHVVRMRRLSIFGKARYLLSGLRRRLNDYRRMSLVQLRMRTGRRLSEPLRDFHFWRMCNRAGRSYRPGEYSGRVLIVASRGRSELRREEWGPLLAGAFDVAEIDAGHDDLVVLPWIQEVGEILESGFEHAASTPRT